MSQVGNVWHLLLWDRATQITDQHFSVEVLKSEASSALLGVFPSCGSFKMFGEATLEYLLAGGCGVSLSRILVLKHPRPNIWLVQNFFVTVFSGQGSRTLSWEPSAVGPVF